MDLTNTYYQLWELFTDGYEEEGDTEEKVKSLRKSLNACISFTAGLITGNQSQKELNKIIKLLENNK